ncbi:hypothetical protein PI124_g11435 [Phytophthora idaei]|nr:hypothetical protein PI125_g15282 [Phytophthora idaei]KAG3149649.1 hypothetical protein PI126_g11916 [Phytophthora idaei]KAG3243766.1 hypothetical protein PI124_g11435 [Phytophthora idaei]
MKWECFVCWKVNEDDEATADNCCLCRCCGRPRNFVPASLMISSKAKPLIWRIQTALAGQLFTVLRC